jgi:hypothetical protein
MNLDEIKARYAAVENSATWEQWTTAVEKSSFDIPLLIAELETAREDGTKLRTTLATVTRERDELLKDKARLNWMESQSNGKGWFVRTSAHGRGYRLHNPDHIGFTYVRDAIDAAMQKEASGK